MFNQSLGDYWKNTSMMQWTKSILDAPTFTIKELETFFQASGKTGKTHQRAENLF